MFKSVEGSVTINLQTMDVFFLSSRLMPVPDAVLRHAEFDEVFGVRAHHEPPFCSVVERADLRQWLRIALRGVTYDVKSWAALPRDDGTSASAPALVSAGAPAAGGGYAATRADTGETLWRPQRDGAAAKGGGAPRAAAAHGKGGGGAPAPELGARFVGEPVVLKDGGVWHDAHTFVALTVESLISRRRRRDAAGKVSADAEVAKALVDSLTALFGCANAPRAVLSV